MLTIAELNRYNRHLILPEIGMAGQEKIKQARVLVIGAGGLGCPVLQYLTAAGVGHIGIVDFDKVDESNLQRQILFTTEDVGQAKALKAAERLKALNPFCNITPHILRLDKNNALDILKDYDLVIDGSDNFPTRYLVNDACVILNKQLVFGSIFKFEGQISVFNYKGGPTYRCLFPEPPQPGEVPNCSEIGVLGVLPGITGTLQANEALKIITGIGDVLSGRLLTFNALEMQFSSIRFESTQAGRSISSLTDYEAFCGLNTINEIDVFELKEKMDAGEDFQLIDVREPEEYEICNLNGELIPMNSIEENITRIAKDKMVVIHCHHGQRSANVIRKLQEKYDFGNLVNLKGGIHAWAQEIAPEMSTY